MNSASTDTRMMYPDGPDYTYSSLRYIVGHDEIAETPGYYVRDTWGEYDTAYCPGGQDAAHELARYLNGEGI